MINKKNYPDNNQSWIVKALNGDRTEYFYKSTMNYTRAEAIKSFMEENSWAFKNWKQAYRKGYRAVKIEFKEIKEW